MLWERRLDTMALIAWGSNRIVVVFRGTNSLKNVLADLEVRNALIPCVMGPFPLTEFLLCKSLKVHVITRKRADLTS